jgi:hypothetical protein
MYIEIRRNKLGFSKPAITYQNHRFKHLNFNYIYPISYKNAKKANPEKGFALLKNDITTSEPTFGIADKQISVITGASAARFCRVRLKARCYAKPINIIVKENYFAILIHL